MSTASDILDEGFAEIAREEITRILDDLYWEIHKLSPIRSSHYISRHRKTPIVETAFEFRASIVNDSDYPWEVEEGWRKTAVNWHLQNGTIYRAKGAKVFERATEIINKTL